MTSTTVTSVPEDKRVKKGDAKNMKKIGVPWHLFTDGVDPVVMENFKQSVEKLKNAGYEIVDVELPECRYSLAAYYIIMPAEVSTNLSRFDGIRYGYTDRESANLMEVYKKSRGKGLRQGSPQAHTVSARTCFRTDTMMPIQQGRAGARKDPRRAQEGL
ncbi:MAG: amidase family protein [bacterium]